MPRLVLLAARRILLPLQDLGRAHEQQRVARRDGGHDGVGQRRAALHHAGEADERAVAGVGRRGRVDGRRDAPRRPVVADQRDVLALVPVDDEGRDDHEEEPEEGT